MDVYETQWLREKVIVICSHNSKFSDHEEGETAMETIYSNRVTSSEKSEHAEGERIPYDTKFWREKYLAK